MASYIIGIDLGTTNSTVSYAKIPEEGEAPNILSLALRQVSAPSQEQDRESLPSFMYLPMDEELADLGISWDPERRYCVGEYAKNRGKEVPTRLISSAKSWLSHHGVDRREKILPVLGDEELEKWSPVEVSAAYLRHIKEAWELEHPQVPFDQQKILITTPASFDPAARQLVEEAAWQAGYPESVLLEEPQAAFYAWLAAHEEQWREMLAVGDTILVVDIGGGTTDFSLIQVNDEEGDLTLERIAVGAHLLLGGDNMDLALAHFAKGKLEKEGHTIDRHQLQALIHECRGAKERLLTGETEVEVKVQGKGRKLIASTVSVTVTKEEVETFLIDGFFPMVKKGEEPKEQVGSGLQTVGLPYAHDPRISAHLAKFLQLAGVGAPQALLCNGGSLKGQGVQERLMELLQSWAKKDTVTQLPGADLDRAVSRGAVYYGLARQGQAIRIRGGVNRSYFVGIEEAAPAIPGFEPQMQAVCIAPFGMEEGTEASLGGKEFSLVLGESCRFRFFGRDAAHLSNGQKPEVGVSLDNWQEELTELAPIQAEMDRADGEGRCARVTLKSKVTELGMLELYCESEEGRRWKLEFNAREPELV